MTGRGWRGSAACARGVDPELFFPLDLDPSSPAVATARQVCAGCPVRALCFDDVMDWEEPARRWGVVAGFTPDERTALATRSATVAVLRPTVRGGAAA
ncbi:WhiB family transcriptional regulator [Pseudonocardia sp. N23]|uniref:WhiB family transcriptional regulator n=1 Tax=Pseudonocardia sp. N23 TaxID=1987376 RepID=UPI000BFEA1D0|nr:WhiB family transcriptional regulator [Pseudonocardia sp. N23]